jgi:hypothetical protein
MAVKNLAPDSASGANYLCAIPHTTESRSAVCGNSVLRALLFNAHPDEAILPSRYSPSFIW